MLRLMLRRAGGHAALCPPHGAAAKTWMPGTISPGITNLTALLHRVGDRVGPSAFRLLRNDRIGTASHQRCHGALVVLRIELAVGGAEQLADFRHHPLLVLLGLGAGGVAGENDL